MEARYVHTNLIARDWESLARFYVTVFGCMPVPPARNYRGEKLEAGTGLRGAALQGIHLRLPGHGPDGPTLEIFSYDSMPEHPIPAVNRPGLGHLAFQVDHLEEARQSVLSAGGGKIGEFVTLTLTDGRSVTWCYLTDPEGNIIELQSWAPPMPAPPAPQDNSAERRAKHSA